MSDNEDRTMQDSQDSILTEYCESALEMCAAVYIPGDHQFLVARATSVIQKLMAISTTSTTTGNLLHFLESEMLSMEGKANIAKRILTEYDNESPNWEARVSTVERFFFGNVVERC